MVRIGEANPSIWDTIIPHLEIILKEFEFQADDLEIDWRKLADARMLERRADEILDEKYGIFKVIMIHPWAQEVVAAWDNLGLTFDLFLGDPLIPFATALIILFMMHKRVGNDLLVLVAAILFNANPIYVVGAALVWQISKSSKNPKLYVRSNLNHPSNSTNKETYDPKTCSDLKFDHVLIGNDISTLYAAAILSKNGHKCCVLEPRGLSPVEVHVEGAPCGIPLRNAQVGRLDRYQTLLDAAQPLDPSKRVVLVPIGNTSNGFAHTVSAVRKPNYSGHSSASIVSVTVLRAGLVSIAEDLMESLGADKTVLLSFIGTIVAIQQSLTVYLMSRVLPTQWTSAMKEASVKPFFDLVRETSSRILSRLSESPETRESVYAAALALQDEALPAFESSAAVVAAALGLIEEGMYYPTGGPAAIQSALVSTILSQGGRVFSDFPVESLVVTEKKPGSNTWSVSGVKAADVAGGKDARPVVILGNRSVISGLGFICTYTKLLPATCLSPATKQSLSLLSEARPKVSVLLWLEGSAETLGLLSCDYFETTSTEPTSFNQNSPGGDSGPSAEETDSFLDGWVRIWSPSAKDPEWTKRYPEVQTVVVELGVGSQTVVASPFKYKAQVTPSGAPAAFPSPGPKVYNPIKSSKADSTGGATAGTIASNAGDLHLSPLVLSKGQKDRAKSKALSKLQEINPLAANAVVHSHVQPPTLGGLEVSSTPEKFLTSLGSTSDIQGLYFCGHDVGTFGLAGELQGGWVAANAVLGYGVTDLLSGRDILTDLRGCGALK